MRTIHVGNLPISVAQEELRRLFARHGAVTKAHIVRSERTGVSRGYAFVEMKTIQGSRAAVKALDGLEIAGRKLEVTIARPRAGRGAASAERDEARKVTRRRAGD